MAAGVGVTAVLLVSVAGLALLSGAAGSLYDAACSLRPELPVGRDVIQTMQLWPPGLSCQVRAPSGPTTIYSDGFSHVWFSLVVNAVVAATMAAVVTLRYGSRRR